MKLVITARDASMDSPVDQRFGRCRYFIIIDKQNMKWEAKSNTHGQDTGGAGVSAAREVAANDDVEVVITGNVGPNAFKVLEAAGIDVVTGFNGTVADAVQKYTHDLLSSTKHPTVKSHHGMKRV